MKREDPQEVIKFYQVYLAAHPDSSRVAFNLGKVLVEQGDPELARQYFERSLRLLPGDKTISEFSRNFVKTHAARFLDSLRPHSRPGNSLS